MLLDDDDFDAMYPGLPYDDSPVEFFDDGYDFWQSIGVDPKTTMENWRSPSNVEIESAIQGDPAWLTFAKKYGDKALGMLKDKDGKYDLAKIATLGIGAYSLMNQEKEGGYSRPVPKLDMVRDQVQFNDPNRRPGEGGRQYFTDPRFVAQGNAEAIAGAKAASAEQAAGIQAAYQPRPAEAPNPYAGKMNLAYSRPGGASPSTPNKNYTPDPTSMDAIPTGASPSSLGAQNEALEAYRRSMGSNFQPTSGGLAGALRNYAPTPMSAEANSLMDMFKATQTEPQPRQYDAPEMMKPVQPDGLAKSYAQGGIADAGRYLQGKTDGMADEIPSSIDGEQPAALSHGEFVIPADVVSHLGNGNSDAGAQKLYEMMDRIRQARTGTTEQGKEINPDEFTMGGLANAYASGGTVKRFDGGGPTTPAPAQTAAGIPNDVSRTSTLSPYVGEYVTDALARGSALAQAPYQAYQGPLTAGSSGLQQQAFAGASEIAQAGYAPGQFTGGFGAQQAQQYMNPYLQASLDPQLKELQRQSDIARMADAGRLTKAGAFGGSRQAIMESEGRRNLLDKQQDVLGSGYKTAYDLGLGQFNKDREADEASRQFGANFGLKSVGQLADLGAVQRGITSEGIAADKAQFEEQRDFAYGMPKYQLGLLSGLPIAANTTSVDQDAMGRFDTALSGLGARYKQLEATLKELGLTPKP